MQTSRTSDPTLYKSPELDAQNNVPDAVDGLNLEPLPPINDAIPDAYDGPVHNAAAPTLTQKAHAFMALARHEPSYRRDAGAMFCSETAAALGTSGYLLALQALGSGGDAAIAGMLTELTRLSAAVVAYHQRDNEDLLMTHDVPVTKRAQLSRGIALHGMAETACNIALLAGLAATGFKSENTAATRAVTLATQLGKTYLSTRYFGLWNCLKIHLGDSDARALQRDYNRTIAAFEYIVFSLMSRTGGTALYLTASRSFVDSPRDLLVPAVASVAGACLLSLAFDANFALQSATLPATPLLRDDASDDTAVELITPPVQPLLKFRAKAMAYAHLVARDPDYRRHAVAVFACRFGLGLMDVGYLHLMNDAGSPADVAKIAMAADFVRFVAYLIAHHERDNEDLARGVYGAAQRRQELCTKLAWCGAPDFVAGLSLIAGLAWGAQQGTHARLCAPCWRRQNSPTRTCAIAKPVIGTA